MADAPHGRVARGLRNPDCQRPRRAGLGVFTARKCVDRRGADVSCGTALVSVVIARRMPPTRRTSAFPSRLGIGPTCVLRDAARGGPGPGTFSYEGLYARDRRRLDPRSCHRRPSRQYRISIAGTLSLCYALSTAACPVALWV